MKKSLLFTAVAGIFLAGNAYATDASQSAQVSESTLKANFRRVALEYTKNTVSNYREYSDSPDSELNNDDHTTFKGEFDFLLEYNRDNLRWNNSIYAIYGEQKTKYHQAPGRNPHNPNPDKTETDDKILFTSDYMLKLHKYKTYAFGPMAQVEYQTEFRANRTGGERADKTKILRGKIGYKVFEDTTESKEFTIKDLYVAAVGEYDMTHRHSTKKSAGEVGWRFEGTPRENVSFSVDGYYRRYLSYSTYCATDFRYDFFTKASLDAKLTDVLSFGPYVSYRRAHERDAVQHGSNTTIGVALTYKDIFDL